VQAQAYSADHPDINLLRLRNYTIGRNLKDEEIIDGNVMDRVSNLLKDIKPFVSSRLFPKPWRWHGVNHGSRRSRSCLRSPPAVTFLHTSCSLRERHETCDEAAPYGCTAQIIISYRFASELSRACYDLTDALRVEVTSTDACLYL